MTGVAANESERAGGVRTPPTSAHVDGQSLDLSDGSSGRWVLNIKYRRGLDLSDGCGSQWDIEVRGGG